MTIPNSRPIIPRLPHLSLGALFIIALTLAPAARLHGQGGDLAPSTANGALDGSNNPQASMKSLANIDPGTPLEPADFPVTISQPGGYYLTGNVSLDSSTAGAAITVNVSGVTIDLRGYSVASTAAGASGAAESAVYHASASISEVVVRNGSISGSWSAGVSLQGCANCRCENLRVSGVRSYGIYMGDHSTVSHCQVDGTAATGFVIKAGIRVGDASIVAGCTAANGDFWGFKTGALCSIRHCTAFDNGNNGFETGSGTVLVGCTSGDNSGTGFTAGDYAAFAGCMAYRSGSDGFKTGAGATFNHCVACLSDNDGFEAGSSAHLSGCTAYDNGGIGINTGAGAAIENCTAELNTSDGIATTEHCTLRGCTARHNDGNGIKCGDGSSVNQCTTESNTGYGIFVAQACVIVQCTAAWNYAGGITSAAVSIISTCIASANGDDPATPNLSADGIWNPDGRVTDCIAYANKRDGISAAGAFVDGNMAFLNGSDGINSSGTVVRGNFARFNIGSDYTFAGGSTLGPIQPVATATSPNANFQ